MASGGASDAAAMAAAPMVYAHEGDRPLTFPPFLPDDNGSTLVQLNAWALRVEGMFIRVNDNIRTLQLAFPGIQLEIARSHKDIIMPKLLLLQVRPLYW